MIRKIGIGIGVIGFILTVTAAVITIKHDFVDYGNGLFDAVDLAEYERVNL